MTDATSQDSAPPPPARAWSPAKRRMWRVQYAGGVLAVGAAILTALAWIFGLQTKAEAKVQRTEVVAECMAADTQVKELTNTRLDSIKTDTATRLDAITQRIDDQSALLKEIRALVLRGRGR